jgi:hypothetical protein
VSDRFYLYIQPDFAEPIGDRLHFVQLRDLYADVALDAEKEYRFRVGLAKVPYGWENMQSSQRRIPIDRNDAFNSGVPGERDLGVFFYWAPAEIRERFRDLVAEGLKGSGDYGVIGFGVYNGQGANRIERNDHMHLVARVAYPFLLPGGQIIEPGFGGYHGVFTAAPTPDIIGGDFPDRRLGWSFVLYPQPVGVQVEYTIGVGPELNEARTAVETGNLHGGYVLIFQRMDLRRGGTIFPFLRAQYYRGGQKALVDIPRQRVDELEIGAEWQPTPHLQLTADYMIADRTSTVFPYRNESGSLLRLQFQLNY